VTFFRRHYLHTIKSDSKTGVAFPKDFGLSFEGVGPLADKTAVDVLRLLSDGESDWRSLSPRKWQLYMALELYSKDRPYREDEFMVILETKKLLVFQMLQRFSSRSIHSLVSFYETVQLIQAEINGDILLPKDVVRILREICLCFSQLLLIGKSRVRRLYHGEAKHLFRTKEQMPYSRYRYRSNGALRSGMNTEDRVLGVVAEELLDALCVSCERNLDRSRDGTQLDELIEGLSPSDGGLLDILDDPVKLRELPESPWLKRQHLKRPQKMLRLIKLLKKKSHLFSHPLQSI
jgi:hypothetical protein